MNARSLLDEQASKLNWMVAGGLLWRFGLVWANGVSDSQTFIDSTSLGAATIVYFFKFDVIAFAQIPIAIAIDS